MLRGWRQARALGIRRTVPALHVCAGIVTYDNPPAQLRRAVLSLQIAARWAGCRLTVLAMDNGGPASAAMRDEVTTLPSAGNVGFGATQNRLMASGFAGGADAFLALNPDAVLHPHCLTHMLRMHLAARERALIE